MSYPKWVSRGHGIGAVLCLDEAEEAALLALDAGPAATIPPNATRPAYCIDDDANVDGVVVRKKPGPKPKVK